MNRQTNGLNGCLTVGALMLVMATFQPAKAQNPQQQSQNDVSQTQLTQADQMLGPLNLTPDQIQKIRGINADLRDQRQAANLRLRQSQRALAEAVESPNPNEDLIEQRSREVGRDHSASFLN
jgi:Spy/CpxP family protein refolding chaperone